VSSVNLDHSTVASPDEPVLREPLRAKLAKWRKGAAEIFAGGPAHFLTRAAANGESTLNPSVSGGELLPESCEVAPPDVAAVDDALNVASLLAAYRRGLLAEHHPDRSGWLSPAKREVIAPHEFRLGPPLRRLLQEGIFSVSFDEDFAAVLAACKATSPVDSRLAPALTAAFISLHREGHAHSVEVRTAAGALAGGLYGVAIGKVFFAEAKFEHVRKASTFALAVLHHHLSHWDFALRSARWAAPVHMVGHDVFQTLLDVHAAGDHRPGPWTVDPGLDTYAWSGRPRRACRRMRNGPLPPLAARKARPDDKHAGPDRHWRGQDRGQDNGASAQGA
jgi:leucyl/phenylalanyl-tRNA--protein transferase